jgi:hypothetical protein
LRPKPPPDGNATHHLLIEEHQTSNLGVRGSNPFRRATNHLPIGDEKPMNCILLLGAGFSRNWNGRLASEVRSELQTRLHGDQHLQRLFQRNDFETVVAMVQAEFERTPNPETTARLHLVQDAVKAVFQSMNDVFVRRPSMEFGNDAEFMIQKYLVRFDAIFTLNQDLLPQQQSGRLDGE